VCDLVTAAELEQILGVSPIVTKVVEGPPDTCDARANDVPVAALVLTPNGKAAFQLLAAGADATAVSGIGDAAFSSSSTGFLVVLKGDTMLSIALGPSDKTEEQRLEALTQIGTTAVGRM
jgi:hypothetical protein